MLNTTSTSASQSVKFNSIFVDNTIIVKDDTFGKIFNVEDFAKGWDTIYRIPNSLQDGEVRSGMRKLTEPTLLITTKNSKMAYVIASEESPVFICEEESPLNDGGYLLAYRLLPEITPEYVYYLCKFDLWDKIINNISGFLPYEDKSMTLHTFHEDGFTWDWVRKRAIAIGSLKGSKDLSSVETTVELTVGILKGGIENFDLPSLTHQKELVESAKEQESKIDKILDSSKNIGAIVDHYIITAHQTKGIFHSGFGLLSKIYRIAAGDRVDKRVIDILSDNEYCENIISEEEEKVLARNLNETFQSIMSFNGMIWHPSDGFIQPQEVTNFLCKIADFPDNIEVYNPFSGANSYGITLRNNVIGEEINPITWALGQIRLFANKANNRVNIKIDDSFKSIDTPVKYEAIISSPVYLKEKGHEISDIVEKLYDKLEDGGKLVCIISAGFLFQKDNHTRIIRERLLKERAVASVVMLPSNIFANSSVSQAIIIIEKNKNRDTILFADASGYTRYAKSVYRATTFDWEQFIRDLEDEVEDYLERGCEIDNTTIGAPIEYSELIGSELTPSLYLTPKPKNGIALAQLVDEVPELRGKDASADYFLTGSSIPAAMHRKPFVPNSKAEEEKIATAKNKITVPKDAVLIALVSGNVRTVYTKDFTGNVAFPGGLLKVLKPKNGISAKYLAALISTKLVADQIKAQTQGLTIPRLNRLNLSQILVPLHETEEDREKLISEVLSSEMSELESELQQTLERQKREIKSTRHAMGQTLSALSSNWEQFKLFCQLKKEGINLEDIVGRINPISLNNLMGSIEYAISTLEKQLVSLKYEQTDWGNEVAINPYKFINDYIRTHSTPSVRMINIGNDNTADVPYFEDDSDEVKYFHTDASDVFYAPERLLERIFNNIVSNAKAHGFTSESINNEIRFDWKLEEGNIVITISNNGQPLKSGVTGDDVLMNDFTTALNEKAADGTLHSGQGGYEIKSLMEGLGSVEVISQPDAEFPVIYKLTFEKTNSEIIEL